MPEVRIGSNRLRHELYNNASEFVVLKEETRADLCKPMSLFIPQTDPFPVFYLKRQQRSLRTTIVVVWLRRRTLDLMIVGSIPAVSALNLIQV